MEQTVNLFTKGLQMDTHPMVQGNDVLSDALNATFVTMNGNEVILQNDMGNRRIDNAFLPAGYLPVGIKEYGGIIYIACYNPLTGRGQIGSFPSPLLRFSSSDMEIELNLNNIFLNGDNVIKREQIFSLTNETLIHAGDKFIIYSSNINGYSEYISNYSLDNCENKQLTFLVGVLNSQNEFVDITNSLMREGGNGYYIWEEFDNSNMAETISDADFIRNRMAWNMNSYGYKLVGPLCLKAILNYPHSMSYEIYGEKGEINNNVQQYNFTITVTYTNINFNDNNAGLYNLKFCDLDPTESEFISGDFDPVTELYIYKKEYSYSGSFSSFINNEEEILNYSITPYYNFLDDNEKILQEFETSGKIELNKLATDTVVFNGWRYYNKLSSEETIFNLDISIYPKRNSSLRKLQLYLVPHGYQLNENISPITLIEEIRGIQLGSIIVPWISNSTRYIQSGKLYDAYIKYTTEDGSIINIDGNPYYFVSTKLFNGNYVGSDNIWSGGIYDYSQHSDLFIENFTQISQVQVNPTVDWKISIEKPSSITTTLPTEKLISEIDSSLKYINTRTIGYKSNIKYKISYDKTLYPTDNNILPNLTLNNIEVKSKQIGDYIIQFRSNGMWSQDPTIPKFTIDDEVPNESLIEEIGNTSETAPSNSIILFSECYGLKQAEQDSEGYVRLTPLIFKYKITEYIIGENIQSNVEISNVITSFGKFVEDNGLAYITSPYSNFGHGDDMGKWTVTSGFSSVVEASEYIPTEELSEKLSGNKFSDNKNVICNTLLSGHDLDLFVADFDDADAINYIGKNIAAKGNNWSISNDGNYNINGRFSPQIVETEYFGKKFSGAGYCRIWLRYNQNSLMPIIVYDTAYDKIIPEALELDINSFCYSINRWYAFKDTELSGEYYILDLSNCKRTKSFDLESYTTLKYQISSSSNSENFFCFNDNTWYEYTFLDYNITSSSKIKDIEEFLLNPTIETALLNDSGHLIIKDSENKDFDFLYVYTENSSHQYVKSYLPINKKSLGSKLYLPNLDNGDLLIGANMSTLGILLHFPNVDRVILLLVANDRNLSDSRNYFVINKIPDIFYH